MHCSNKKKSSVISAKEFDELCDLTYEPNYDFCGYGCPCCAVPPSEHEKFYLTIAEIVADIIIKEQSLNAEIRSVLIAERMEAYTMLIWGYYDSSKLNDKIREDIAFIWPRIKDTKAGHELFAHVFGQND